jgi:hypothetical protein
MLALFEGAALLAVAPCGVMLAHGSPNATLSDAHEVDALDLHGPNLRGQRGRKLLRTLLTSYGQRDAVAKQVLQAVGGSVGMQLGVMVHGHDRDEMGFFIEGNHQLCPVLFGALRRTKSFLVIDLGRRYPNVHSLREGHEIRRLYGGD